MLIEYLFKFVPALASALGGPSGSLISSLISSKIGVNMSDPNEVINKLENDPSSIDKLKELDLQISDLQNARLEASKETGIIKCVRPLMALLAMVAIFSDIVVIHFVNDELIKQVLVIMMVFLVWDIRQIYKFYFGSNEDIPSLFNNKK